MALELKMHYRNGSHQPGKALVVMIHGLNSSPGCWMGEGQNWVQLLLDDADLDGVDVATAQYDTVLVNSRIMNFVNGLRKKPGGNPTRIDLLARALKNELNSELAAPYDSVVLVGHSMGGLVAICYLLEEIERDKAVKVRGYISLATPFGGSYIALLRTVFFMKHEQIEALMPKSDFLHTIEVQWKALKTKLAGIQFRHFFGEQDGVVNEDKAIPKVVVDEWDEAIPLPGGHSEVLHVTDHNSKSYRYVKEQIMGMVKSPAPTPPVPPRGSASEDRVHGRIVGQEGSAQTGISPETNAILTKFSVTSRFELYRAQMRTFIGRFPSELQVVVEQAVEDVYSRLAGMSEPEFDRFLERYRFPFRTGHAAGEGIRQLWEVLALMQVAFPGWMFHTDDEIANLKLSTARWKRLLHSVDQETMPEIVLALRTRHLEGPSAGRSPLFPHRLILSNVLRLPDRSVCRHCKQEAFPFHMILRDFACEENSEVFGGVEPASNTFAELEEVEVCCTTCLHEQALKAGSVEELHQAIRDVI